jgi:polysaccharide deacetylase 2 family uncharacterized protein YibQ
MTTIKKFLLTAFCLLSALASSAQTTSHQVAVVLIIDDLGNNYALGRRALELPGKLNMAFLPHVANTPSLAKEAHQRGHEILLHAPMSNLSQRPLGPGGLTETMGKNVFLQTLRAALDSVPHAVGINNHMGSLLTQKPEPMAWLMQELNRRQLYFVDSRTSAQTIAAMQAKNYQVPHLERKVFLDHQRDEQHIQQQFERLITAANQQGIAVGIGHPYPETLGILEKNLPALSLRGVQLIYASEALSTQSDCPISADIRRATQENCYNLTFLSKSPKNRENAKKTREI